MCTHWTPRTKIRNALNVLLHQFFFFFFPFLFELRDAFTVILHSSPLMCFGLFPANRQDSKRLVSSIIRIRCSLYFADDCYPRRKTFFWNQTFDILTFKPFNTWYSSGTACSLSSPCFDLGGLIQMVIEVLTWASQIPDCFKEISGCVFTSCSI